MNAKATPATEATAAGDHTATVTLDEPIVRGDQRITAVTLRRPKAGELRGIDLAALVNSADYGALETLLPRISSPTLTRADVANLDPSDLVQFATQVVLFFVPKTAAASLSQPA